MEELLERMSAAIAALELLVSRMSDREVAVSASAEKQVGRIVATVESEREAELMQQIEAAEAKVAEAEAKAASAEAKVVEMSAAAVVSPVTAVQSGRKTMAAGVTMMLAKQGVAVGSLEAPEAGRFEAGALDTALSSLSIEQRFAVKAEMLRAGLLG